MKKMMLAALAILIAPISARAAEAGIIECEGGYRCHLQGLATDGTNIWWSFTDEIVKTDKAGKKIASVKAPSHQGDCCYVNGKLYVAVNTGEFNTEDKANSWVYRFDGVTLELEKKWKVPELRHGAGGMTFANGDFYIVGGLPPDHTCNYVYRYSPDFKFKKRYVLKTGYTGLGIQTAAFEDGKFYFGCYSGKDYLGNKTPSQTLVCPADLSSFRRAKVDTSVGLVKLDDKLMVAVARRLSNDHPDKARRGKQIGFLKPVNIKLQPLRILAIGNSFTISVMNNGYFPEAIKAAGEDVEIAVMYIGGCPLSRHWHNVENAGDENYKPYIIAHNIGDGKRYDSNIPRMLKSGDWDFVTIQQVSSQSFKSETYEPYTTKLIETIRKACPFAQIVFQQTWSYTTVGKGIEQVGAVSQNLMYANLTKAYKKAAGAHGLDIIPTGLAVEFARRMRNVNVPELTSEERAKFAYPKVPTVGADVVGKFYWSKDKKSSEKKILHCDEIHLNKIGEYLQSCTWLKFFCPNVDIVNLPYYPKDILTEEEAKVLRMAAEQAVEQGL